MSESELSDGAPDAKPTAADGQALESAPALMQEVRQLSSNVVILVGGVVTSLATVALNFLFSRALDFNLLSLSFWFVVPAGAVCGGMAAASGYYAAARLTHSMPSRTLLFNMVAVAASTWILSKWISYATLTLDDGIRVADVVPFWEYFKISTEAMQLTFKSTTTESLGSLGYVREALQLIGFMAGGFASYLFLGHVEACSTCRKYAKTTMLLNTVSGERMDELLDAVEISLPGIADDARAEIADGNLKGFSLFLYTCPRCQGEWLRPATVVQSGDDLNTRQLNRYAIRAETGKALRSHSTRVS